MTNLIKSGYIKRYLITKDGVKGIQIIFGPDDVFPLNLVRKIIFKQDIYTGPEQYYYESMTDVEMFSTSPATLQEALEKDPLIYKDVLYAASLRLSSNIYRFENMSLRVANKKVAHQLVYLADIFGKKNEDGTVIMVPLTHQDLADMLNLARETVTLCLVRLEEKGLIRAGKHITVLDAEGLRQAFH
ncbi:MAG TPA: Crp/Fnr family transcriptional regulator [Candidatus Saccharimonadales bacterium]|nr:Crp/Fnr family transcriptional regulator [Candidatus Saccharimonadales bacterium]